MSRPLILICNDDGIQSKGVHELVDIAIKFGDVIAVAPQEQHSGQSSAITVGKMLRIIPYPDYNGAKMFSVTGTPVDCAKIAFHTILPRRPDIMLSGINHGSNAGNCAVYSGTVGATLEACMAGIPSVAFSLLSHDPNADFSGARALIEQVITSVLKNGLPKDICLNVNFPKGITPHGLKVARAAHGCWTDEYVEYRDPMGFPFYFLAGHFINSEPDATDTDEYWLSQGYASVVPVRPDQSAIDVIPEIEKML